MDENRTLVPKCIFYYFFGTTLEIARPRPYYWHSPLTSANSQLE
jgi:hypothetical protein